MNLEEKGELSWLALAQREKPRGVFTTSYLTGLMLYYMQEGDGRSTPNQHPAGEILLSLSQTHSGPKHHSQAG